MDKSSHPGGFFAAQALCAANQVKPKARSFCHRTARLVLPDFARSCPYDGLGTNHGLLSIQALRRYYYQNLSVVENASKKASDEGR